MRKILTFIVLIAALAAIIYVYFNKNKIMNVKAPLYNAIPNQFPIAVESENWFKLLTKLDTLSFNETINKQDWYIGSKVNLNYINELKLLMINENENLDIQNALVAYGNAGNSRLGILLAISVNEFNFKSFKKILKSNSVKFSSTNYNEDEIITIKNFNNQGEASLTYKNGMLLFSFQPSFIEEAIISLSQESVWQNLIKDRNLDSDAYLYLNPNSFNFLSSYLLKPDYFEYLNLFQEITQNTVYELGFFNEEIILNGYSQYKDSSLLKILNTKTSLRNNVVDFLPSNTAIYKTYAKSDLLSKSTNYTSNNLSGIINENYSSFILESYNENLYERNGVLIALNEVNAIDYLNEIDAEIEILNQEYDYTVYASKKGIELNKSLFLNDVFSEKVYFSIVDQFLILSSNLSVVEQYINKYLENDFLKFDENFTNFRSSFSQKSNLELYVNLEYLQAFLATISTENTWQNNISKVDFQFSSLGDVMFSQGKINLKKSQTKNSKVLWSVALDTISSFKTQLVVNHNNNETEILTQDDAGNLYLISKSGSVIWKIEVADLILSEIFLIDYYKNNKYQYVFNTENKIYIIDRNGDNVDGFPINLPSKATNPMQVVNYDNAGIYRYWVACENGNVYGYEQKGTPLSGWNPLANVGVVTQKIQHEVVNGLDFIFFNNKKGVFYALNRKGENRYTPVATNVTNNPFQLKNNKFVSGNKGTVSFIDLKGEKTTKSIADSTYIYFEAVESLLQEKDAYAFANFKNFKLQESQWKNMASFSNIEGEIRKIESFITNNRLWFLIYTKNSVYLIDELGNLHPDFPLLTYADIRVVPLIEGKDRLIIYTGVDAKLNVLEIKWSSL